MRRSEPLDPDVERELAAIDAALEGRRVDRDLEDLAVLSEDLRATAPQPSPEALRRMDPRITTVPTPRVAAPRTSPRRWVWAAAPVMAALLVAVVVVSSQETRTTPLSGFEPESGAVSESGGGAAPESSIAPAPSPVPPTGRGDDAGDDPSAPRQVEHSTALVLFAPRDDVQSVADRVVATTDRVGGIVASSSTRVGEGQDGEAIFDLRIPTDRLDEAIAAYSGLASVAERTQDTVDITGSVTSARERLTDARAERRGLVRALARADGEAQVERLRERLRAVRMRLERHGGELAALRRRAELATVSVTVRGDGSAPQAGAWTPGDAADDALRVLQVAAGVAIVALAVLVPLALVLGPALLAGRRARRRRREGALDTA